MELGHAIFLVLACLFVAVNVFICVLYRSYVQFVLFLMIVSTMFGEKSSVTFMHQEWYKSATWGFNITISDLCLLVLFIVMFVRRNEYRIRTWIPLTTLYLIYFVIAVISWASLDKDVIPNPLQEADDDKYFFLSLFPLFGMWKILRLYFGFWVLTNFLTNKRVLKTTLYAFGFNIIYLFFYCLYQRYVLHYFQVDGGLESKHVLNAYIAMLGGFFFPFIFTTPKFWKKLLYASLIICSFVVIILTVGRSALAGFSISILLAWLVVFPMNLNFKNISITAIFGLLALAAVLKALNTLGARIDAADISETFSGREDLNLYAYQMATDHFWGVGLGNYPAWYVVKYGVIGEDVSIAHNMYFLILGELGFLGLFTLICIHLRTLQMFIFNVLRLYRNKVIFMILIASMTSWLVLWFQDLFHFTSLINPLLFLQMLMVAYITRIYIDPESMKKLEFP